MLDRKPGQLSGGQRQRVAMGRAIIREPEVFLFDEPLSNLDAKLRVQMRHEIRRIHRAITATSVFVTHDQTEAMTLADQLVVMNRGRIEQCGAPREIYDRPATLFVAGFVGTPAMNVLAARIDGSGTGAILASGERLKLGARTTPLPAGCEVRLGIRPVDLSIANDRKGDIEATFDFAEELGSGSLCYLSGPDGPITLQINEHLDRVPGAVMRVQIAAAAIHIFDATSGLRLGDYDPNRRLPMISTV